MNTRTPFKFMVMRILGKDPSWEEKREEMNSAVSASFVKMSLFGLITLFTILFVSVYYKYAIFSVIAIIVCFVIMIWFVLNWAVITSTSYILKGLEEIIEEADNFNDEGLDE